MAILQGEKVADLPVQQSTWVHSAKTLGLTVVCTENSIPVDHVNESPNVGNDDRAVLPLLGHVRLAVQVEEPT